MLRSSSTCPMVMMIGSKAAVIRSPVAHAAINASATSRSVMPCKLGWRRLAQASENTGIATSAAATPATSSEIPRCAGRRNRMPAATTSRHKAASASVRRRASNARSERSRSGAGTLTAAPVSGRRRRGCRRWRSLLFPRHHKAHSALRIDQGSEPTRSMMSAMPAR